MIPEALVDSPAGLGLSRRLGSVFSDVCWYNHLLFPGDVVVEVNVATLQSVTTSGGEQGGDRKSVVVLGLQNDYQP